MAITTNVIDVGAVGAVMVVQQLSQQEVLVFTHIYGLMVQTTAQAIGLCAEITVLLLRI